MSVEMITVLIGIVSILLAFAGAFGWMVHRMDLLENRLEHKLGARIDGLDGKISALDEKLSARIDRVADELVEVKIAIARVEGPPRHLLPVR
ncbi:hypothetical protein ACTU6U_01700 [Microbacterium sp. A196]|uniref:hypothetical protein n=1 Tax=Microbacterium sp. A196 TaxID=3457320 RepID=UPI003FCF25F2